MKILIVLDLKQWVDFLTIVPSRFEIFTKIMKILDKNRKIFNGLRHFCNPNYMLGFLTLKPMFFNLRDNIFNTTNSFSIFLYKSIPYEALMMCYMHNIV